MQAVDMGASNENVDIAMDVGGRGRWCDSRAGRCAERRSPFDVGQPAADRPTVDETIAIPWASVRAQLPAASAYQVRVLDALGTRGRVAGRRQRRRRHDGRADLPGRLRRLARASASRSRRARAQPTPAKRRVYAVHTDPRDDVAWESDRIAFRIYGQGLWKVDSLNSSGLDIWVKRMREPIVEKWYAKGHDDYHRDTGEGADFFDVGETLGAGGTAIWRERQAVSRAATSRRGRVIANGPVRAIFELQYQPWDAQRPARLRDQSASRSTPATTSITSRASSARRAARRATSRGRRAS